MYKIAIIGDRDSIYGFAALGIATYPVSTKEEATKTLKHIAVGSFAVIYTTEALYSEILEEIEAFRSNLIPAIIPLPGVSGNNGSGIENFRKSVERAVGSDIIFNNEN